MASGIGEFPGIEEDQCQGLGSVRPELPRAVQPPEGDFVDRGHLSRGDSGTQVLPVRLEPSQGAVPPQVRGPQGTELPHPGEPVPHLHPPPGDRARRTHPASDMAPFPGYAGLCRKVPGLPRVLQRSEFGCICPGSPSFPGCSEAQSPARGGRGCVPRQPSGGTGPREGCQSLLLPRLHAWGVRPQGEDEQVAREALLPPPGLH